MYDGHICTDHDHQPRAAGLPDITSLVNNQIRKVYLEKLQAGDVDADTWRYNTEQMWKAIQEGWEKAPQFFRVSLLELRRNVNTFAAFKNHANVIELTQLLIGTDGEKVSFSQFKKLAQPITDKYNVNWLKTEYDYATKAARSAAQWDSFQQRGGKLEYMTVGDGRVREAHRELEGTILPVDAPFWKLYYPPNGWNCRCFVRWRPGTTDTVNPTSLPDVNEMFLNNVGLTSQVFTDDHPFIREIGALQADKIRAIAQKATMQFERDFIGDLLRENLKDKTTPVTLGERSVNVQYSAKRIKHGVSQPHINIFEKNRAMLNIENLLKESTYVQTVPNVKQAKRQVKQYHYLLIEIAEQPSYIVLEELLDGNIYFYSIVDSTK